MIVRTASNPTYTIYNLGQNQILLGQDVITPSQLGSDFNFAGPGAVMWDFNQFTLDLWVSHHDGGRWQRWNDVLGAGHPVCSLQH
jgi:hypothetical protein